MLSAVVVIIAVGSAGETDWKILVIDVNDEKAAQINGNG